MRDNAIWRSSPRDAWLVLISCVELGLKLTLVAVVGDWPPAAIAFLVVVLTILNSMNYECAGHYFIHRPFFKSPRLNALFGIVNSLAYGFPQTLYRTEHLNHHRYGMDYRDAETGRTADASSIYRFGRGGDRPEPVWRYALLSPFRQGALGLVRATPKRLHGQLALETAAVLAFLAVAAWVSLTAFALLMIVSWAGAAGAHVQNWLKHAHAVPGSRLSDSVSCYGRLYNFVWFNNGHHQEHHFRPATHWTELPALRREMRPDTARRVVPHAHFWNLSKG